MSETELATLRVAKLIKLHLFLDAEELKGLLEPLPSFKFYQTAKLSKKGEERLELASFISKYGEATDELKRSEKPPRSLLELFSLSISRTEKAFVKAFSDDEKLLLRPQLPVVQLAPTFLHYNWDEKNFRFGLYGKDSFLFGMTLVYPQIYQDSHNLEIIEIDRSPKFPNSELFSALRSLLREKTRPTPFLVQGKKINVPVRIGPRSVQWAGELSELKARGIQIDAG